MSDTYDRPIVLAWEGAETPPLGAADAVIESIRDNLGALRSPAGLIFHHVFLTDDDNGPTVLVRGRKGSDQFHCTYYSRIEWFDLDHEREGPAQ